MDKKSGVGSKHQNLYKCSTPPWKDTYRKRCFDRLKKSRDKFMERFRGPAVAAEAEKPTTAIQDLMNEEWNQFQRENPGLGADQIGEVDSVLHVFEEIRRELLEEEQAILREYDASQAFDEQMVTAAANHHLTDQVICPVCQRNKLMLNKGIVFCYCGIRLDTEQDCMTLPMIAQNLREGVDQHAASCGETPSFSVVNQVGMDNLLLTCQMCDMMFVVI